MRRREIFLDFTSLLDVVLIILFFFILFSHMEIVDSRTIADKQMAEAEAITERANEKLQEAEKQLEQLESELELVRESDARRAENAEGMLEFVRNQNVKMILEMDEDPWCLKVVHNEELVTKVYAGSDMTQGILAAFNSVGYEPTDTIFCEFVLDGSQDGTASAYRTVNKGLAAVRETYRYLYYSETDMSMGED